MKNYGLQVKEIPIIFRGTIDGATIIKGDPIFDDTIDCEQAPNPANYASALLSDISLNGFDKLNITYNGVEYIDVPKREETAYGITYYFWGADYDLAQAAADFTDYPFFIAEVSGYVTANQASAGSCDLTIYDASVEPGSEPTTKIFSADLTGNGQINRFYARFACGENGTLHLKPYVILNGNIRVDLCNFAQGGDQYIAGDNEEIEFDCYVPVETHATAYVEAENVGEYPSLVDAAMTVQYEDFIESESIVGYEGVNLRRGRR